VPSPSRRRASFGRRGAAAAALLAVIVAGLGVLRVWPPLAVVMSGSMTPTIKTGDMVVLMHLHRPARVGEVVEVPVPDDARARYGYPPVVIHRVFRITGGQIRTKGDARPAADPFTVPQTAVEARVVADIPAGGRILSFFHSGPGLLWLLFGAALFFGLPLLDRLRDARGREAEATADLRDQLAAVSAGLAHLQSEQERSRRAADETLAQLDRLTRLVAGTLGEEPSAPDGDVPAPEATPGKTAASPNGQSATSAPASADSASTCETATEPMAASASEPGFDPVPDSVDAPGSAPAVAPEREVRSAVELKLAALAEPAPPGETANVGRESAPPLPALERWDALPAASALDRGGWAAAPVPLRSARFQHPGRLIAASLAQPSPVA
jgi:signal peptidase I